MYVVNDVAVVTVLVSSGVTCLDVSVEAELLVAGSDDGVMAVWSLADKQLIHTLLGHTGRCVGVLTTTYK